MGKNTSKNVSKDLSSKYGIKLPDHAKQSSTDAIKTFSKIIIQKIAEATELLLLAIKLLIELQNYKSFKKFTTKYFRESYKWTYQEIPKEQYVSPEERQEIIDELRLK